MPELRKPTVADVTVMHAMMRPHIVSEALLPRTRLSIVQGLRDYVVAIQDEKIVGLASVSLIDVHLAEVGAVVCDQPEVLESLMVHVLAEARQMGVDRVFVLAPEPLPYERLGFSPAELTELPEKRDRQCLLCPAGGGGLPPPPRRWRL